MKRPNVHYRPLQDLGDDSSSNSENEFDEETTLQQRLTSKNNDDFVEYQTTSTSTTWDRNGDSVKFQKSYANNKIKKKFQQWIPEQFLLPQRDVPWKSIMYAVALFIMGTILLLCGCLIHVGKVDNEKYGDRLWPLIIFGLLMFIPGSYHVFLVFNVFRGKPGYTFDDFPQFED